METKKCIFYSMVVLSVFLMQGCSKKKNLESLSPRQIINLYNKARNDGDFETLRKIIYFPQDTSEEEKTYSAKAAIAGQDEKAMMSMAKVETKAEYEAILDDNTAEVGLVIITGISNRTPFQQIIMKKDEGIWKYDYDRFKFSEEQLVEMIRKNPDEAWPYYYLGRWYQPENPAMANRYYKKYYELEPEGFWVSKSLMSNLKTYDDIEKEEREALAKLLRIPAKSPDRAGLYIYLAQLFTEYEDYQKAQMYLQKASDIIKDMSQPDHLLSEDFEKAKQQLHLQISNQYSDVLTEIEARENANNQEQNYEN